MAKDSTPVVTTVPPPATSDGQTGGASEALPENSGMPEGVDNYVNWHLQDVKDCILRALKDGVKNSKGGKVNAKSVSDAVDLYSRIEPFPPGEEKSVLVQAVLNVLNVPGIIWISAILSIVFGILGAKTSDPSLSDIAKVFAGAIVGASGATATAAIRRS